MKLLDAMREKFFDVIDSISDRMERRDQEWLRKNPDAIAKARADHQAYLDKTDQMLQRLEALRAEGRHNRFRVRKACNWLRSAIEGPYLRLTRSQVEGLKRDLAKEEREIGSSISLERSRISAEVLDLDIGASEIALEERRRRLSGDPV